MANKTRTEILAQIYEYLPQINQTSKATLVNNAIDLAVEVISGTHNFRCFRASSPDAATLATGAYYLDLTDFTVMGGATGYYKEILSMFRLRSGHEDHAEILFLDDKEFHRRYGYIDYTDRQHGYPRHYTQLGNRFIFNCPASEALSIRCWYQKFHPPFATDGTSHSFYASDNQVAFQAIVYQTMLELKSSLSSAEFPMDLQGISALAQGYIQKLIARDMSTSNEDFQMGWSEKESLNSDTDPYSWV